MAIYTSLSELLNTTRGMSVLRNNVGQDDGTDIVDGVEWFVYNGAIASSLYVSGNSYVGFGSDTAHLKVCNRNGKMWYLYRQEGFVGSTRFLKIRWEGYTRYNYTSTSYALKWELFLFDDGGLYLNLVTVPTSSSYLGTSALVCGANTYSFTVATSTPVRYSFLLQDDGSFVVSTNAYPVNLNRVMSGSCEFTTTVVRAITAVKSSCILWDSTEPEGTAIKVYAKLTDGSYLECERNGGIPCVEVGSDLSNESLYIKVEMTTNDIVCAPVLHSLAVQVYDVSDMNIIVLTFDAGNAKSLQRAVGDIIVTYDGSGTVMGQGGPVLAFEKSFAPVGLDPKNNPHDAEHIELLDVNVVPILTRVYYTNVQEVEHIELCDIVATGALIHIDDI